MKITSRSLRGSVGWVYTCGWLFLERAAPGSEGTLVITTCLSAFKYLHSPNNARYDVSFARAWRPKSSKSQHHKVCEEKALGIRRVRFWSPLCHCASAFSCFKRGLSKGICISSWAFCDWPHLFLSNILGSLFFFFLNLTLFPPLQYSFSFFVLSLLFLSPAPSPS